MLGVQESAIIESSRLMAEVDTVNDSSCCLLAQKIACYILGAGLIAGGVMTLTTSLSGMQILGGFSMAGGVALIGRAIYLERDNYDAENAKYEALNKANAALIDRLEAQNVVSQSATIEYANQNQNLQQNISNLDEGTGIFKEENDRNSQVVDSLNQLTDRLDANLASLLSDAQNEQKIRSNVLSEIKSQITQFHNLIAHLQGELARPFEAMLQRFESFESVASELDSTEKKLRDTQQRLHSTEEKISELVASHEKTVKDFANAAEGLKEEQRLFENEIAEYKQILAEKQKTIERLIALRTGKGLS